MPSTPSSGVSNFRLLALPFQSGIASRYVTYFLDMTTIPEILFVFLLTPIKIVGYAGMYNLIALLEMIFIGVSAHDLNSHHVNNNYYT